MTTPMQRTLAVLLALGAWPASSQPTAVDPARWQQRALLDGWAEATLELRTDGLQDPAVTLSNLLEPHGISVNGEVRKPPGPELGLHGGWHQRHVFLSPDARNVVTVRFRAGVPPGFLQPGGTRFGSSAALARETTANQLPRAALAVTSVVLGLVALMLFTRRRDQKLYLSFSGFATAHGLVLLCAGALHSFLWDAPAVFDHLRHAARAVAAPSLVLFFAQVSADPLLRLRRGALVAGGVGLLLVGADLATRGALHLIVVGWNNLLFVAAIAVVVLLLGRALRRSPREFLPCGLAVACVAATSVVEPGPIGSYAFSATAAGVSYLLLLLAMGDLILRRLTSVYGALHDEVRARDEFLSVVSHELRNPLAAMIAGVELLLRQAAAPEQRQHLEMVRRQGRLLTRLMDDLLDLGRIRAGRLKVELHPLALGPALSSAVDGMRHAAEAKNLSLQLDLPAEPVAVEADPIRLEQMVTNLIRNAIQHTAAGGRITVSTTVQDERVAVSFQDTGRGLSSEALQRLFSSDARLQNPANSSTEGMGVGLALVKKLSQLHGGSITAHSEGKDRGCQFILELKRAPLPVVRKETPLAAAPTPPSPAPDRRVLVIDDNANLRLSMRLLLEHSGYRVQEAADGRSGLETLLTGAFDAAVVDLRMPEIDGLEVARRVRAQPAANRMRLVALTGLAGAEDRDRARAAGFDHVLVKPADPEKLAEALR